MKPEPREVPYYQVFIAGNWQSWDSSSRPLNLSIHFSYHASHIPSDIKTSKAEKDIKRQFLPVSSSSVVLC